MPQPWQPMLEGESAERAWEAIQDIAEDLKDPPEHGMDSDPQAWSLAAGVTGSALFLGYLAQVTGNGAMEERACDHLVAAQQAAASRPGVMGLWEGLMGVSWSFDHLEGRLFEAEQGEQETTDTDAFLSSLLENHQGFEDYDLIQGLSGFGIACLEGLPRPGARRGLDLVLDRILEHAESHPEGIAWLTPPWLLPEWQRDAAPEGYYNLGAAHGMPALVTLMARSINAGIRVGELTPILEGLVRWMLTRSLDAGFPGWIGKGMKAKEPARLAWCYGDPGVAGALLTAAKATGNDEWQAQALQVARRAARRDPEDSGVLDAGLCHGTAGLALIFNRLSQQAGCHELAESTRYWLSRTLDWYKPGQGVGGYQIWTVPRGQQGSGELGWFDDSGLLNGSVGVGLSLLAAVTEQAPDWDRVLLLSAPDVEGSPPSS